MLISSKNKKIRLSMKKVTPSLTSRLKGISSIGYEERCRKQFKNSDGMNSIAQFLAKPLTITNNNLPFKGMCSENLVSPFKSHCLLLPCMFSEWREGSILPFSFSWKNKNKHFLSNFPRRLCKSNWMQCDSNGNLEQNKTLHLHPKNNIDQY